MVYETGSEQGAKHGQQYPGRLLQPGEYSNTMDIDIAKGDLVHGTITGAPDSTERLALKLARHEGLI